MGAGTDSGGGGGGGGGSTITAGGYVSILTTAVRQGWHRRGLGALLVRWVQRLAAANGVRCMLVAASHDVLGFWRRLGFSSVPREVPTEWVESLEQLFDHSSVLFCDPFGERTAEMMAAAVQGLAANGGGGAASTAKRQRVQ